jgi:hypothetical protein
MLRLLVLLLLLGNAGYFAWSHGMLAPYGFAPAVQSEPQRLAQQLRPEALRILTPLEARQLESTPGPATRPAVPTSTMASAPTAASTAPPTALFPPALPASSASSAATSTFAALAASASRAPPASASSQAQAVVATQCLQVGLFNDEQTAALRTRLQNALPTGSWAFESSVEPARWMIYMGKYSSLDALAKKRGELRQINVSFEPLNNPALEPGLSLGNFGSQLEADTALARIATRGVKTAKVIQTQTELRGQKLKLAAVTPAMRTQLEALKPQLAGKTLQACR